MSYATPAQLADGPSRGVELAQLFNLDTALLLATLDSADRSAWTPDEQAAADAAVATIEERIALADAEIDRHLAGRYTVPLSPVTYPILRVWSEWIARYLINRDRDRTSEETGRIERDYNRAIRALEQVAAGKLSLGASDTTAAGSGGSGVQMTGNARMFSRDRLGKL